MRKMAAARRITRDTFDAVVQEKMKKYRMNRDDAIDETIEQFQLQVPPPRPAPRPPLKRYEEDFEDDGRYESHPRGASRKWKDELREDFPGPSFAPREYDRKWTERRRTRSPFRSDEHYYEGVGHPRSRDRDLGFVHSRSRDTSWSRKGDFDRLELDEFGSSEMYDDLQDYDSDYLEHPVPPSKFRGRDAKVKVMMPPRGHGGVKPGLTRGAVAWKPKKPVPIPKKMPQKGPQFLLLDESDVFSKFSNQIVKWAGFDTMKDDDIFMEQCDALFQAETEACAKMLASFKCALKQGHRDYIFFCVQNLNHPALKSPKLDNEFLNLLIDKGIIKTKNCFFEIIKPFDKYLMNIQERLLKSVIPLLMACNAYEVDVKAGGLVSPVELSNALEKSVSLCRKSLVLLGQTFSITSSYRQEKILEAVGLQEMAPNPTGFPNLDDCFLFGREYMAYLKRWLEKSGYPIQLQKRYQRLAENKAGLKLKAKSQAEVLGVQPADPKVIETIDQLVEYTNKNEKAKADEKEKPPFWFLFEETSLEYKYYRVKLAEVQSSRESTLDAGVQTKSSKRTPEELATESVRAMLYARKATQLKRKLFRNIALSRRRKIKRVTAATQTVLSSSVMIKMQARKAQTSIRETASSSEKPVTEERYSPSRPTGSAPSPRNEGSAEIKSEPTEQSEPLSEAEILQIDAKTKDTAEKLAQFVAQVGPEIEKFSMENSASNPEFGFLHEPKSPAYRFYRMKVTEFRQTMDNSKDSGTSKQGSSGSAAGRIKTAVKAEASSSDKAETEMECDAAEAPNEGGLQSGVTPPVRAPLPRKRVTSLKVGILPKKRVCLVEEPQVHDPVRIGYDRPRGRPAARKVKQKPKDLEFVNKKLTDQNVGFQMLRKMGWKEGQGLGSSGAGIKDPVKVGATSGGEGLGVEQNKEDTFDVFRQWMMQMYKQKKPK
uniref:SURP and G-patch domain-containing protein 2-like n=1 Tax=Geotrypetes seraphini TaxID=260995 RepID=A0A6P8RZP4_GEOSA|nr:SURP and G-patch domain-containing protein 2-like [Geotrypetes seraphini]XP_033810181.1 SURP and G-patch domain-containing protein 2-like [Geotrypetes seraphini]